MLQWQRRSNPNADDPLFRPIDADDFRTNGENASDFSNLRQNGLIRITFPLPPNIRLIDPATNLPSAETSVDVWRMVPTVNDVALTGPDGVNPGRADRTPPAATSSMAHRDASGSGARRADQSRADSGTRPRSSSRRPVGVSTGAVHQSSGARARRRRPRGYAPLPDRIRRSTSSSSRARLCSSAPAPVPRRPGPIDAAGAGSAIPRHRDAVPASGRYGDAGTICLRAVPARLARNARTYEITLRFNGTTAPPSTSSDPGRALLTGFVGGPPASDDWNKFDVPGLRGISKTAPYFHNNSADTLEDVVDHYIEFFKRVTANAARGRAAGSHHRRRAFRPPPLPEERTALLAYLRKL